MVLLTDQMLISNHAAMELNNIMLRL